MRRRGAALVAALSFGCVPLAPPPDAGPPPVADAGVPAADAGGRADAGGPRDAGLPGDAGAATDAGGPTDAGAAPDAGPDAGTDAGPGDPLAAARVILFILDGVGPEQRLAARMFASADTAPLSFETFPVHGTVRTGNYTGGTTDSAAAATAMATGFKVRNRAISRLLPGDGRDLETALERFVARGRRAGLITTETDIADATPAAFGAHVNDRVDGPGVREDFFALGLTMISGRPGPVFTEENTAAAGFTPVTTLEALQALEPVSELRVAGLFAPGSAVPLVSQIELALTLVDQDPDGFFLLVEHEGTDTGGHNNNLARVIRCITDLADAVELARTWAQGRDDVLILVTSDHETGGLTVTETQPQAGVVPAHAFGTTAHTGIDVDLYAWGHNAERFAGTYENTHIYTALTSRATASFQQGVRGYAGCRDTALVEDVPDTAADDAASLALADGSAGGEVQGLLWLDDVLADVPAEATDLEASLLLSLSAGDGELALHLLRAPLAESATWTSAGAGVALDDTEADAAPFATATVAGAGVYALDVTDAVTAQLSGDHTGGWLLRAAAGAATLDSCDGTDPPRLLLRYRVR